MGVADVGLEETASTQFKSSGYRRPNAAKPGAGVGYKVLMAALQSSYLPGMRQLGSSTAATGSARNFKPTYFET
jgi:hypothetical protein